MSKRHPNPAALTAGQTERLRVQALQAARTARQQACMAALTAAVRGVLGKYGCGLTVRATLPGTDGGMLTVETSRFELLVVVNDPPADGPVAPGPGVADLVEFQRRVVDGNGRPV